MTKKDIDYVLGGLITGLGLFALLYIVGRKTLQIPEIDPALVKWDDNGNGYS